MRLLAVEKARALIRESLSRTGLQEKYIGYFESALIETSLKGIDTHGIRLLPLYIRELREGRANINPNFQFEAKSDNIYHLDADHASGIIAGQIATHKCIDLAKEKGVGIVTVNQSNHFGAASIYGDEMARNDLIGFVTTSAAPRVVPFNGKEKLYGTDPICFTAPIDGKHDLFSLDMATSQVSYSKVKEYLQTGKSLEPGWGLNADGLPTESPEEIYGLAPVGGYKGQGLSMMTQILSSVLSGAPCDFELTHLDQPPFSSGRQIGHFFMAFNIGHFLPLHQFKDRMQFWAGSTRNAESSGNEQVMIPGDPEQVKRKDRLINGIPLTKLEYEKLTNLCTEMQLDITI